MYFHLIFYLGMNVVIQDKPLRKETAVIFFQSNIPITSFQ